MILRTTLWCLSVLNNVAYDVLRTISLNTGNRKEKLEATIQDDYWLASLRNGTFKNKEEGFLEHYVLKIGETLQKYSKDWTNYHDFVTRSSQFMSTREIERGDYRDILAKVRALTLSKEESFNKEDAFEAMFLIYCAMENRLI